MKESASDGDAIGAPSLAHTGPAGTRELELADLLSEEIGRARRALMGSTAASLPSDRLYAEACLFALEEAGLEIVSRDAVSARSVTPEHGT